ncbi:hypothetical protein FLL45_08420 [Aliikangiella marina]|uniref:DUF6316 domain-containing protein n=1 Tax=Aliikangiella marina TaxID=1712262 RepID=A0A545TCL0_9GAMM|nr:DUF6316 family protein [Aliikangiella marina]TQV74957.1 hypothetical protein FLL45_08420 [Aliikangiella marina]
MNIKLRAGEPAMGYQFTRTNRLVVSDDGYFYRTRECDLIGPFFTEAEALYDLNVFVKVSEIEQNLQLDDFFDEKMSA